MMPDVIPTILDFEEYLKKKDLTASSIYVYSSAVKKFLLTGPDINSIDSYNDFIFEFAIKKRSNYVYDALKLFIKWRFEKDPKMASLTRNLLKSKVVDPKKVVHYLDDDTREEVIKVMENYKHRIMARIQDSLGVRAGDVLRLKRGTINYEVYKDTTIVMRIDFEGKGGRHYVKWVFDKNLQTQIDLFIKSNIVDTEYYFLERIPGQELHIAYMRNYLKYWKDLKQALRLYGIEYTEWATHDFRRSFARNVWDLTKDPVVLKEMLNHARFDTTLRYLRGSGLQSKDVYADLDRRRVERENA